MIQKAIIIISVMMCLITPAIAEDYDPGLITSDSPLWQLDLAIERITEQLMLSTESRINLQLKHADERLGEIKVSTDVRNAADEYNAVLARIKSNDMVNYQSTKQINSRMAEHNIALSEIVLNGNDDTRLTLSTAVNTNTALQEHARTQQQTMMSADLVWWQGFISQYPITHLATSITNVFDEDLTRFRSQVPDGISQVIVTQSDESYVAEYIVNNDGTDIFISTGRTPNPAQTYTFTISEIKEMTEGYL